MKPAYWPRAENRRPRSPADVSAGGAVGAGVAVSVGQAPNTSLKASTYACSSPAGPLIVIFRAFSGLL